MTRPVMEAVSLKRLSHHALLQQLPVFVCRAFRQLNGGTELMLSPHILALCHALTGVLAGEVRELLVTMPPRHLKSFVSSVCFPAWALAHDPRLKIIGISYSAEVAEGFARATREIMESVWYQELVPRTKLDPRRATVSELRTTAHGFRMARSLGGSITASGGDILILDDPLNAGEINSQAERDAVNEKYSMVLPSRLDDQKRGAMIVVAQRLHSEDLPAKIIEEGGWTHLDMPTTARLPQDIELSPGRVWHREPGDLLHPERLGPEEIARLRKKLGSAVYSAQYECLPIPLSGHVFDLKYFRRHDYRRLNRLDFELIVQSWDTALLSEERADRSACTTWGVQGDKFYLLNAFADQLAYPDLLKKVFELKKMFRADVVIVEHSVSGITLLEELIRRQRHDWVIAFRPHKDKRARAEQQLAKIEAGNVYLPRKSQRGWLEAFEKEVVGFPRVRNDDWVDSMTQFLRVMDYPHTYRQLRHLAICDGRGPKTYLIG